MDRNGEPGLEETTGLGCPLGIHMTRAQRGSPAPHRQQGDVELPNPVSHGGKEIGVAGKINPGLAIVRRPIPAADDKAKRLAEGPRGPRAPLWRA